MSIRIPILDENDDLGNPLDVDLNAILAEILPLRTRDPVLPVSRVVDVESMINTGLPIDGQGIDSLITNTRELLASYSRRNTHPGFFGYIASCGLMTDPLANLIASSFNQNVTGFPSAPAAATIERTVVQWLAKLAGFSEKSEGIFLSGGSLANMIAIGVALTQKFGHEYRVCGLKSIAGDQQPKIICSQTVHFSVQRAAALLGIGTENVISLDVDDQYRLKPEALKRALGEQTSVVCVIASAGTTTHGAIDPLEEIAQICLRHEVWFHVDAAYGGAALMSPILKLRLKGIDQADSVTMDLHKWFYTGFDSSVLLYKNPHIAREMFFEQADYVQFPIDGPPEQHMFFHMSPELSRRFRALPAYIAFAHYGFEMLGRNVLYNVECARYLADRVLEHDELELVYEPQLSIVCFRYISNIRDVDTIDKANQRIRSVIEKEGQYFMSATSISGRPVLRTCIVNHATRTNHLDQLLQRVIEIGSEYLQQTSS